MNWVISERYTNEQVIPEEGLFHAIFSAPGLGETTTHLCESEISERRNYKNYYQWLSSVYRICSMYIIQYYKITTTRHPVKQKKNKANEWKEIGYQQEKYYKSVLMSTVKSELAVLSLRTVAKLMSNRFSNISTNLKDGKDLIGNTIFVFEKKYFLRSSFSKIVTF